MKPATVAEYIAALPEERTVTRRVRSVVKKHLPKGYQEQFGWGVITYGKKFDMGKSCLHFTSLDDLPLDVVADVVASTPMDAYIERYRSARKTTARGK